MVRHTLADEQVAQPLENVLARQLLGDVDRKALHYIISLGVVPFGRAGHFLGGGVDAHRDNEVRSVLAPIAQLAKEHSVAVVVVAHRRKSAGSNADETCLGSRAFTGIARAVWHLSRDTEDKAGRLLLPGKNNLGREGSGLAFSIIGEPARIFWEGDPVEMTADDQLANENQGREQKRGPGGEATRDAEVWLQSVLANGPRPAKELIDEWVNGEGGGARTLERAKATAGVEAFRKTVPGCWHWRLTENNSVVLAQEKQLGGLAPRQSITKGRESD